jgi:hypothetical protein
MSARTITILLFLTTIFVSLSYYAYRAVVIRRRDAGASIPALELVAAAMLLIIGEVGLFANNPVYIHRIISPPLMYYSLMLSIFANKWLFDGSHENIVKSRAFLLVSLASIVAIILDVLRGNNTNTFLSDLPYEQTVTYYLYYIYGFFVPFCIELYLVHLFWADAKQSEELTYRVRRKFGAIGWAVAAVGSLVMEFGLCYSIVIDDTYRRFSTVFFSSSITVTSILLISNIIPQKWFNVVIFPVVLYDNWRKEQRKAHKMYLYDRFVRIMPSIRHRPEELFDKRLDIELQHARYLFWTCIPRNKPITPHDEAEQLFEHIQSNKTIDVVGDSIPQPINGNPDAHNASVVRYLKQLEGKVKDNGSKQEDQYGSPSERGRTGQHRHL